MSQKMVVEKFKGLEFFELDLAKGSTVRGSNATGKTTLKDAYLWALTERDSLGRSNHEIKTRKGEDTEHQLDHLVEIHEKDWAVRRVYREEWNTKRGQSEEVMTGHTTEYYISENGNSFVKVSKNPDTKTGIGGFDQFVRNKAGSEEKILAMIDPLYFSEKMHWKKRREVVFEVAGGEMPESEIAKLIPAFPYLSELIAGTSASEAIVIYKKLLAEIDKQLNEMRVCKKEATRAIPKTMGDHEKITAMIAECTEKIKKYDEEIRTIESGANVKIELAEANRAREFLVLEAEEKSKSEKNIYETKKKDLDAQVDLKNRSISKLNDALNACNKAIQGYEGAFNKILLEEYKKSETCLTCGVGSKCPKCGEIINEEYYSKAEKIFNTEKSKRLQGINEKTQVEVRAKESYESKIAEDQKEIEPVLTALKNLREAETTIPNTTTIDKKIADLKAMSEGEKEKIEAMTAPAKENSKLAYEVLEDLQRDLGVYESAEKQRARVLEIEGEQDRLKEQHAEAMKNVVAIESLIWKKVELAESKIIEKFGVKFKMFDRLQNGGIVEVCEPMILVDSEDLIPFSTANNAGRITTGLLMCEVLQRHYGCDLPVFVDNAESIVKLPCVNLRIVAMYVDERYPKIKQII